jgi:hypothetical protein
MWFKLAEGATGISVQGQEFSAEVIDEEGRGFFRAPDHFAPLILDLKGFEAVGAPPGTDLPDLPQADPERDTAITRMTMQIQSLTNERDALREQNKELQDQLSLLTQARPSDDTVTQAATDSRGRGR